LIWPLLILIKKGLTVMSKKVYLKMKATKTDIEQAHESLTNNSGKQMEVVDEDYFNNLLKPRD